MLRALGLLELRDAALSLLKRRLEPVGVLADFRELLLELLVSDPEFGFGAAQDLELPGGVPEIALHRPETHLGLDLVLGEPADASRFVGWNSLDYELESEGFPPSRTISLPGEVKAIISASDCSASEAPPGNVTTRQASRAEPERRCCFMRHSCPPGEPPSPPRKRLVTLLAVKRNPSRPR